MRQAHIMLPAVAGAFVMLAWPTPAQPQDDGFNYVPIHHYLRNGLTNGVSASATNGVGKLEGRVVQVFFGSDPIPGKPAAMNSPCLMGVMLKKLNGGTQGVMIDFANVEGVAKLGGTPGFVNPPYSTSIYINGGMFTAISPTERRDLVSITLTFQMMNTRDRAARAMTDLQAQCMGGSAEGGY